MSSWREKYKCYSDGITKVVDPFWHIICDCGHTYLSCVCNGVCPRCGGSVGVKTLGGIPYEQIIAERGEPIPLKSNEKSE